MYWLLGRNFKLSTYNKLLLYKQILKLTWTYCNSKIISRFQNKLLRNIIDACWYFRKNDFHRNSAVDTIDQTISKIVKIYK